MKNNDYSAFSKAVSGLYQLTTTNMRYSIRVLTPKKMMSHVTKIT